MFKKVNPKQNFPEMEKSIINFWKKDKIFEKSVERDGDKAPYSFFDGPPFATGLPHYGHVVASLIKDVIPRYWTMRRRRVARRWGWDCHGLPIENLIEKEHDIKNKQDIEKWGIDKFNDACHASVLRYADEWKKFIPRIGRWVDMENDYKTMDWKYTESIWWVFSELYKKGLVYEGYKPMHICPRCETTLSNFEVTQGYKEITDLSATVEFKIIPNQKLNEIKTSDNFYILAWTTTPWTLFGNVALAVGESVKYMLITDRKNWKKYVISEESYTRITAEKKEQYEIEKKFKGKDLVGIKYEPLFDYYSKKEDLKNRENGWKIYAGDFVSTEEGTGIVHIAPAFGEDDMKMGQEYDLPFVQHVKMNGRFTGEVADFKDKNGSGMEVKPKRNPRETDEKIVGYLEANGKLFSKENYKHSYPHCWRCDTPLLNYASNSWFVKVTEIKDKMIKNNQKINWTPEYIKDGRFGKWLEDARDWAVSRSRFWGAPLPVWRCKKCRNTEVISSIDRLRDKTNEKITKFIILRHGESESNVKKIKAGQDNKYSLTDKGIKQSKEVAEKLKGKKIDVVISSSILRAKETAEIVSKKLGIDFLEDELIREYNYGSWNGFSSSDLLEKGDAVYGEYRKLGYDEKRYNFKLGGNGESRADVENRVRKFINNCLGKYPGKNILVVAHGGINAMFHKALEEVSMAEALRFEQELDNAGMNVFYADKSGRAFNLHKPNIDAVKIECSKCKGEAEITGEVFDCWFESGSMPYAQWHYPFENEKEFKEGFPADFIAEGLDQTRGWFYTLIVLSTALFDKPAFKNVIVNGIVLAEDGQKMSKRLKNYPEPNLLVEKYGADALRYYLFTSPVMKAENLRFSEKGVDEVLKRFILIFWNVYSFFTMNASLNNYKKEFFQQNQGGLKSDSLLDKWIVSEFNILTAEVNKQMENYDLVRASRPLREFMDKLSNWYLRRSRKRFASEDEKDKNYAFQTLYYILAGYSKLAAPFMPFLAEEVYKNLTGRESVHLEDYPAANKNLIDEKVSGEMNFIRSVVTLGLAIRAKNSVKVRMPLAKLKVEGGEIKIASDNLLELIRDELNVKEVEFMDKIEKAENWAVEEEGKLKVALDLNITEDLRAEGFAREIVRHIQAMRKEAKYSRNDLISIEYNFSKGNGGLQKVFDVWGDYIKKECLAEEIKFSEKLNKDDFDLVKELAVGNLKLEIGSKRI